MAGTSEEVKCGSEKIMERWGTWRLLRAGIRNVEKGTRGLGD
jgi:hypothetical protein